MNLVYDEGVDRQIVDPFGPTVTWSSMSPSWSPGQGTSSCSPGLSSRGALLLTADKDFGELVFRQQRIGGGVVLLRLAGLTPERKAFIVSAALARHGDEMSHAFSVIAPGSLRIRQREMSTADGEPRG